MVLKKPMYTKIYLSSPCLQGVCQCLTLGGTSMFFQRFKPSSQSHPAKTPSHPPKLVINGISRQFVKLQSQYHLKNHVYIFLEIWRYLPHQPCPMPVKKQCLHSWHLGSFFVSSSVSIGIVDFSLQKDSPSTLKCQMPPACCRS